MFSLNRKIFCGFLSATIYLFGLSSTANAQPDGEYWKQRYEIIEEKEGVATVLDHHTGDTFPYCIGQPQTAQYPLVDTLYADTTITIETWNIDTTQFAGRFQLMGTIPIYGLSGEVLVYDSDNNGLGEIIGEYKALGTYAVINRFYEWDPLLEDFVKVVDFGVRLSDKGGQALLGGDIDQDGYQEVYFSYSDSLRAYEATDSSRYSTVHRYSHTPIVGVQPSGNKIGDFDGDGAMELLNMRDNIDTTGGPSGISAIIREHVSGDTGFKVTSNIIYPQGFGGYGQYAVEDFDLDGHVEFMKSNVFGRVCGIENAANDSFRIHYQAQLPTGNAFYHFSAGDLDGDGLPECFLGGKHGEHNFITVLESCSNDCYHPVLAIDIVGGWGIYGNEIVPGDVDGDGVDEFAVDIGGMVLMFKVVGNNNYELFWVKQVAHSDGIGIGDVDGDGNSEIIIAQAIGVNGDGYSKSTVYKYNPNSMSINPNPSDTPKYVRLYPNYPNPFNSNTTIWYDLNDSQQLNITIYNIIGKEVVTLREEYQPPGNYSAEWNGRDDADREVASGVYLLRITGGSQQQVRKMLLIR